MPKLTVRGVGDFEITAGKRLVKALVDDAGTDQLHACGGQSKCTSCRIKFIDGEPEKITQAEKDTLSVREISDPGVRLSCQITCDHDMTVEIISGMAGSGRADQGSAVADEMVPDPIWTTKMKIGGTACRELRSHQAENHETTASSIQHFRRRSKKPM